MKSQRLPRQLIFLRIVCDCVGSQWFIRISLSFCATIFYINIIKILFFFKNQNNKSGEATMS